MGAQVVALNLINGKRGESPSLADQRSPSSRVFAHGRNGSFADGGVVRRDESRERQWGGADEGDE